MKVIYEPRGQAFEYAELATNPYNGCGHKCAYCYVPKILSLKNRNQFDLFAYEKKSYIENLKKDCISLKHNDNKQILLSFTTDPYHPFDTSLTTSALLTIAEYSNNGFSVLTKGGLKATKDISLFRKNKDAFATTLTSLNDNFTKKWESSAALPNERIEALKIFHNAGIFTWVSIEPTLDVHASIEIIKQTHKFVNHFKIGKVNYCEITKNINWEKYTLDIINLCASLNISHYIKKDLQKYLPINYYNPLRINQYFD